MSIELYEFAPTRSQRARWTLLALAVPFESIAGQELIGSDRLRAVHPLAKLPALKDDGRPLFESAAISTWLADSHPEKGLIAPAGTWERALHDQWVAFAQTELEAHLWST
ncbi:MAG: glutathione S-transferase family protein, partial [Methyloligellaceae bacterium]